MSTIFLHTIGMGCEVASVKLFKGQRGLAVIMGINRP